MQYWHYCLFVSGAILNVYDVISFGIIFAFVFNDILLDANWHGLLTSNFCELTICSVNAFCSVNMVSNKHHSAFIIDTCNDTCNDKCNDTCITKLNSVLHVVFAIYSNKQFTKITFCLIFFSTILWCTDSQK